MDRPPHSRAAGSLAEDAALSFLQRQGLTLLERNYHCRRGEIDLIMQEHHTLVFVEVRSRRPHGFGSAAESVDYRKQQRLLAAAAHYLQAHPCHQNAPCRFDVIGIATHSGADNLQWIKNAFEA